jgi:hypothetical protein
VEPPCFKAVGNSGVYELWCKQPDAAYTLGQKLKLKESTLHMTMDAFMLQSLCNNLDAIECIERMIAKAEARKFKYRVSTHKNVAEPGGSATCDASLIFGWPMGLSMGCSVPARRRPG